MSLFRRREPLHERLAREGGLGAAPLPEAGPPGWMESGIHGVHRAREWDAVLNVEVQGIEAERARFVALADDTLVVEEGGDVDALAEALDDVVPAPYRAEAVRRGESHWAVGIRRIQVVELPESPDGDELTLTMQDGGRTLVVDGQSVFGSVPELERLGSERGESYVVQGKRLVDDLWEIRIAPI